jgi:hypothetical protein
MTEILPGLTIDDDHPRGVAREIELRDAEPLAIRGVGHDGGTHDDGGGIRNDSMTDHSPNYGSAPSVCKQTMAKSIHALLAGRSPDASICPSEVAT